MRKIKTWRDPYDEGFNTIRPREIQIEDGLTVLVGCNGAGKTTLLENIKEVLDTDKIPYLYYDNQRSGSTSFSDLMFHGDLSGAASLFCSSEGEQIRQNVGRLAMDIREFMKTGESPEDRKRKKWENLIRSIDEEQPDIVEEPVYERWLLMDAVDSGFSIDNVIDLKSLFKLVLDDAETFGVNVYIVISANEYELANGESCFDVNSGKYVRFKDYDEFKKFILKSREKKDKRYEKLNQKKSKT